MLSNTKCNPVVTELFIRGRKSKICLVFIMQSYFAVPNNMRLNSKHYFIMKIPTNESFHKLPLVIHQVLTLKILQKMYCKSIFFFSY